MSTGMIAGTTSSPFEPPNEDDRTFVVNSGAGLDTGCTFRSGGPLVFEVETTRFLGPTNADGTLQNARGLVAAGLLSPYATLVLPAFDVDFNAQVSPPDQPERDRIFFNDTVMNAHFSGNSEFTQGDNNIWRLNSFQIPIEKVRFPSARGAGGQPPEPAKNQIRIDIDTANTTEEWCTAIDWAALSIKATSPVILIHGNSSDGDFYVRHDFTGGLDTARLLWDNSINFVPNAELISENAKKLSEKIPAIVMEFGVDSVHLVCHSKGGLDARKYLAVYQPAFDNEFKVLSYTSLSTPHNGSVLADLVVERYTGPVVEANSKTYVGFPFLTEKMLDDYAKFNKGYIDLQTKECFNFNAENLPFLPGNVVYHTVAADLDQDSDTKVDSSPPEWQALALDEPSLNTTPAYKVELGMTAVYRVLRGTATINVETSTNFLGWTTATITSNPNPVPLGNDILVTIPSGHGTGSFASRVSNSNRETFSGAQGRNHSSIADAGVASTVAGWIINVEKTNGDLK